LNKKSENVSVSKALNHHHLIILQFCWTIKGYIPYQINQTTFKSGYYFTNYGTLTGKCWTDKTQTWKRVLPISASCTISRKPWVWARHHICGKNILFPLLAAWCFMCSPWHLRTPAIWFDPSMALRLKCHQSILVLAMQHLFFAHIQ